MKQLHAELIYDAVLKVLISVFLLQRFRIRSSKKMLLLVGGLPPGPDRLPSNLVQYYDDEKKTWKILTSECPNPFTRVLDSARTSRVHPGPKMEIPAPQVSEVMMYRYNF